MPKLKNDKHERFCQEFIKDLNRTQAAIRAGYSEKTAHVQGCQLLSNPKVAARVAELKAKRSEKTKIDANWLLERLAAEADANVQDLYDKNGNLKSVHDWPDIWCTGLVSGLDTANTAVNGSDGGVVTIDKIRFSDRIRRLELIGKHIGVQAFSDRHKMELTGKDGGPLTLLTKKAEDMTDEELLSLIKKDTVSA